LWLTATNRERLRDVPYAAGRFTQTLFRELAATHGADDRVPDRVDVALAARAPEAERVGPRGERAHGRLLETAEVADGAHLERVRDHDAVEAELVAQQVV
jgi:hypothetical protein